MDYRQENSHYTDGIDVWSKSGIEQIMLIFARFNPAEPWYEYAHNEYSYLLSILNHEVHLRNTRIYKFSSYECVRTQSVVITKPK
jgi:hypothetical protein